MGTWHPVLVLFLQSEEKTSDPMMHQLAGVYWSKRTRFFLGLKEGSKQPTTFTLAGINIVGFLLIDINSIVQHHHLPLNRKVSCLIISVTWNQLLHIWHSLPATSSPKLPPYSIHLHPPISTCLWPVLEVNLFHFIALQLSEVLAALLPDPVVTCINHWQPS